VHVECSTVKSIAGVTDGALMARRPPHNQAPLEGDGGSGRPGGGLGWAGAAVVSRILARRWLLTYITQMAAQSQVLSNLYQEQSTQRLRKSSNKQSREWPEEAMVS